MSSRRQIRHQGRFLRFVTQDRWEYVERVGVQDVAVLVPITDEDEIVLVEQFRIPVQAPMIELPAGLVGDEKDCEDEDLLDAANRELEEETGFRSSRLTLLGRFPSSGGMTSELVSFVLAQKLAKVGAGGGVDGEEITVHCVPLTRLGPWLRERERRGQLLDPKIYAGLAMMGRQVGRSYRETVVHTESSGLV